MNINAKRFGRNKKSIAKATRNSEIKYITAYTNPAKIARGARLNDCGTLELKNLPHISAFHTTSAPTAQPTKIIV